jgi:N12 class adenine-specific DNA methylase
LGVSESQRLALHKAARAALGEEEGDTLMELTPPSNTDIATRQDVERAEERLRARIDAVDARLGARIDAVDARIDTAVAASTAALTKAMHAAELRTMSVIVLAFLGTNLLG